MIVCPRCGAGLFARDSGYACQACSYSAGREDDIVFFDSGSSEHYQDFGALDRYEKSHPWFTHRLAVIRRAFADHVGTGEDVLEIGAGTGHTAWVLKEDGFRHVSLGEIDRRGLQYAKQHGFENLYVFDLRTVPFREHFDVVALFDVLEHVLEDGLAIRNIRAMLRPGGRVILTVPAHMWLWSEIDTLSRHCRRYTRTGVASLLEAAGFELLECRYFFSALVPALLVRSLLARNVTRATIGSRSGMKISKLTSVALRLISGPGDALLHSLRHVTGGSLLAVARTR